MSEADDDVLVTPKQAPGPEDRFRLSGRFSAPYFFVHQYLPQEIIALFRDCDYRVLEMLVGDLPVGTTIPARQNSLIPEDTIKMRRGGSL